MNIQESARKQIGDNKLPNKYWVSVSNDYGYYDSENNVVEWAGDFIKGFKSTGGTVAVFKTYAEAKKYIAENFQLGMLDPVHGAINRIAIEDRLSGEVYEESRTFNPITCHVSEDAREHVTFTKKTMEARGVKFQ